MKRISVAIMLIASCSAYADLVNIPSPNDLPIFWSVFGNENPKYKDASFKAQEAFFIQTGVMKDYNMVKTYVNGRVDVVAREAQKRGLAVVQDNVPFLLNKTFLFVAGATYTVGVKKQFSQSFHNPVFPTVNHSLGVDFRTGAVNTNLSFPLPF